MHKRVKMNKQERAEHDFEADKKKAKEILADNPIPQNSYWDDANNAYDEIMGSICMANEQVAEQVQLAMSTPARRALIKDENEVAQTLTVLTRDIGDCQDRLKQIREQHAARSGMAKTPEEMIEAMEINEAYRVAISLYHDNTMPMVRTLLDMLGQNSAQAQAALAQQELMADRRENIVIDHATDVTVVTDVVAKSESKNNES